MHFVIGLVIYLFIGFVLTIIMRRFDKSLTTDSETVAMFVAGWPLVYALWFLLSCGPIIGMGLVKAIAAPSIYVINKMEKK